MLCSIKNCMNHVELKPDRTAEPGQCLSSNKGVMWCYPLVPVSDKCWFHNRFSGQQSKKTIERDAEFIRRVKNQAVERVVL